MTKPLSILIASAMTFAAIAKVAAIDSERPTSDHEQEQGHEHEKEKKQKYTCPMHPEVVTDRPGNCPKCGMKLILKKEETKAKPKSTASDSYDMHQHHGDEAMSHQMHGMQGHESHDMSHMQMSMHSSVDLADPM